MKNNKISGMKLFTGFSITGPEVRWIPPSEARGRPYGFWESAYGGRWVYGTYEQRTFWTGDTGGLSRMEITKRDAEGRPLFQSCPGPSWSGEQTQQKTRGDPYWEDIWDPGRDSPDGVDTPDGYKLVIWDVFQSSWSCYLKSVGDGLYMERVQARAGAKQPYMDEPPCKELVLRCYAS